MSSSDMSNTPAETELLAAYEALVKRRQEVEKEARTKKAAASPITALFGGPTSKPKTDVKTASAVSTPAATTTDKPSEQVASQSLSVKDRLLLAVQKQQTQGAGGTQQPSAKPVLSQKLPTLNRNRPGAFSSSTQEDDYLRVPTAAPVVPSSTSAGPSYSKPPTTSSTPAQPSYSRPTSASAPSYSRPPSAPSYSRPPTGTGPSYSRPPTVTRAPGQPAPAANPSQQQAAQPTAKRSRPQ